MRLRTGTTCATTVLVLALAGCSGGGGQAQPQQPAPTAAAPSASSTTSAASSPAAGVTAAPAARALAPNSAQGLGGAVPQVPAPADPRAATLVGYDHSLRLLGAGPVDEVVAGVETLRAGDGQRLHLVRYALTTSPDPGASSSSSYSSTSSSGGLPAATVLAGGQRIPVPLSEGTESAVAVSVPMDAASVALELESGAGTPAPPKQGLDLLAMARLPGAPEVLYRPGGSAARTVELDVSEQLSYTRTLRGSYPVEGTTSVQAQQARLAWWLTERPGQLRTPSRPNQALLVLTVAEGGGFDAVEYPAARWRLSYPGGPSGGQPAKATKQEGGVAPSRQLSWEVPADLTTGTVTLSPGAFTDSRGTRLDFGSSTLRVPLSFPAGN